MLNVSYLKTFGHIKVEQENGFTYTCKIHPANCLCGIIYHDRKQKLAHLCAWFIDYKHLQRCLKDNLFKEEWKEITIYTNTDWNDKFKFAQMLTKYGYNVIMKQRKVWKRKAK